VYYMRNAHCPVECRHDVAALPAIKVTTLRLVFHSASQLCLWAMREFLSCRKQAVEVVKRRLDEDSVDKLQDTGFNVDSIHVYITNPDDKLCKTWKRIKELPITK